MSSPDDPLLLPPPAASQQPYQPLTPLPRKTYFFPGERSILSHPSYPEPSHVQSKKKISLSPSSSSSFTQTVSMCFEARNIFGCGHGLPRRHPLHPHPRHHHSEHAHQDDSNSMPALKLCEWAKMRSTRHPVPCTGSMVGADPLSSVDVPGPCFACMNVFEEDNNQKNMKKDEKKKMVKGSIREWIVRGRRSVCVRRRARESARKVRKVFDSPNKVRRGKREKRLNWGNQGRFGLILLPSRGR